MKIHLTALAALALTACGGDGTGPGDAQIPDGLVAEWYTGATCYPQCGITLERVDSPADTINLTLASTTALRISRAGGYSMNISGARDTTIAGTARAEGTMLVLDASAGADTADYVLEGDYLSLRWRRRVPFTDPTGTYDVRLRGRFRRR